jgi:hypothetical protein
MAARSAGWWKLVTSEVAITGPTPSMAIRSCHSALPLGFSPSPALGSAAVIAASNASQVP